MCNDLNEITSMKSRYGMDFKFTQQSFKPSNEQRNGSKDKPERPVFSVLFRLNVYMDCVGK
jgi:hypothetical protein